MIDLGDQQTLWLNLTNLALGLTCAVVALLVAGAAVLDLVSSFKRRRRGASRWVVLKNEDGDRNGLRPPAAG